MDNRIVVYTYVCGDLLHKGHLSYLENAKSLGDILIVGVLTDEVITKEKKASIIPFDERARLVFALECVDLVVAQYEYSPINNMELLKPDIVVESSSHSKELLKPVKDCAKRIRCKVIILPYYPGKSSSKIKKKIKNGEL